MKKSAWTILLLLVFLFPAVLVMASGCAPEKPEPVRTGVIAKNEYEPANWGKLYPLEYESWLRTKEPRPEGKSKYKKGWDTDKAVYDKLSEFPFMTLLFNGWGFGTEYNEPRGHYYMMIDQWQVDQSRTKAGGACLNCKTPYMGKLVKDFGKDLYSMPYAEARSKIPERHRNLGVACIDCHDDKTMAPKVSRSAILKGLQTLGKTNPNRQEMRAVVCAQCHVTYIVTKDVNMKSTGVVYPWEGSTWGDISIENIIEQIKSDPANLEWTQGVTGFKLGFIRHPEFEFYSRGGVHWKAGVACADCHMPYRRVGANKISDHNVMSPLKDDLRACVQCHSESPEGLKDQVLTIQDRYVSLLNRAGYATTTAAKLFELANAEETKGRNLDKSLYNQAKDFYVEAFYRTVFLGAENSVGFHNPSEGGRIAGDAIAFAYESGALLRQLLSKAGVEVPAEINLELSKYTNGRGSKKLNFISEQEIRDPTGIQNRFVPEEAKGL